jgi:uncharacterized protein YyaL (SSP411 family)
MPNFLEHEDSPYLQQHRNNPINWYPWSNTAFDIAKEQNKTIFISIGYSTCHWCHVMEKEVFEDEIMADFLNKYFICIKVDKEERPDLDKYFQNIYQTLNSKPGGWPTSIFCTPENKPFYAGTYIPLEPKYNIVGFKDLTKLIFEKISTNDKTLFQNVEELQKSITKESISQERVDITLEIKEKFVKQCKNNFEPTYGGFTLSTKFPQVSVLSTLLTVYELDQDEEIKSMLMHTLDNMISGGFYDLIDGGFCRYSVDSEWLVPHFEKMMYDNGLLCELYLQAYNVFHKKRYLEIADEISVFVQKFMMEEFFLYSASDADTNGVEGEYFIYTKEEVSRAITMNGYNKSETQRMLMRLLVSKSGSFEGKNIIHFANLQKEEWFDNIRENLQEIREPRTYPFVDKKIQTSWSAMMIKSFFLLGAQNENVLELAKESINSLLDKMYKSKLLKHSSLITKEAQVDGYLEDYAYLALALITGYEVSKNDDYLDIAIDITQSALSFFYNDGKWKFSSGEFEIDADIVDEAFPSSVAAMIDVLLSLGSLVDDKYRELAYETIIFHSFDIDAQPISCAYATELCLRYLNQDKIVKVPYNEEYKNVIKMIEENFVLVKYVEDESYQLCSNSGCYKKGESLEELLD